jgi:hypothetical protein
MGAGRGASGGGDGARRDGTGGGVGSGQVPDGGAMGAGGGGGSPASASVLQMFGAAHLSPFGQVAGQSSVPPQPSPIVPQ